MKWFASCIAVLAVVSLGQCLTSSEELMNMKIRMVKDYFSERQALLSLTEKVKSVCPGYGTKFQEALTKVEKCSNDIDEERETMCSTVANHLERCAKPVVEMFEECLPAKSKDLPSFIIKVILSTSDYICKTDGEHIIELSNPCFKSTNYRTQRCIRKLKSKFQQYGTLTPSKANICQVSDSFLGCFQSHLQSNCGNIKTREAFLNLYNAARSSCRGSVISVNEVDDLEPRTNWVEEV